MAGKFLKITVDTESEFRRVQQQLSQEGLKFRSHLLPAEKEIKVVLRGLPRNIPSDEMIEELKIYGLENVTVINMYKGPKKNNNFMPLYLIKFPQRPCNEAYKNIQELFGVDVTFEAYHGRKGPTQCHRCQGFFHSSAACFLTPKCLKCSASHLTSECGKDPAEACICVNCGGPHPANYKGCPRFPSSNKKPVVNTKPTRKVDQNVSFARVLAPTTPIPKNPAQPTANVKPTPSPSQSGSPNINNNDIDFLNYVMVLEQNYDALLIIEAIEQILPALRNAKTAIDRQFLIYKSVVHHANSNQGD